MRRILALVPLALASACVQGCAITKALYVAIVHNSGAPPRAERQRIDEREREFLATLARRRVVVLPVAILGSNVQDDTATAQSIASQLRSHGFSGVRDDGEAVRLPFEPQPNESAIFWSRFKALAARVAEHPRADADYVLLVDVFGRPERHSIAAVHVMAVTANGEMAYRSAWNSHQALYKEIQPHTLDDAARMVVTDLTRRAAAPVVSER